MVVSIAISVKFGAPSSRSSCATVFDTAC